MLRKILISTACFLVNFYGVTNAYGQCNSLGGQWEGTYTVKPYVYGFSVGFCEYQSSMKVQKGVNGSYEVAITNTMVDGDGKAGKKCQQEVVMKATMTCEDNDVRLVTKGTAAVQLDIISQLTESRKLDSEGSFKAKIAGYKMKINYQMNMDKKKYGSVALGSP